MFGMNPLMGMKVVQIAQYQGSKPNRYHRKKRIQKKYAKKYGMKMIPWSSECYRMGDTWYVTPDAYQKLLKDLPKVNNYGY